MSELGKTRDPAELIPGKPDAINKNVIAIRGRGLAMDQAGDNLKKIDAGAWKGKAGDAFQDKFSYEPGRWHQASDAFIECAKSLENYASTLRWAQGEAGEAIRMYEEGEKATERAKGDHAQAVGRAQLANERNAAAGNPARVAVAPFSDPGEEKRQAARDKLNRARQQLTEAGDRAGGAIRGKGDEAPETSMWDDIGNGFTSVARWVGRNLGEVGHTALDIAGLVPGIGEFADLANAGWYAAEGKKTEAALSAAGAIPFAGWAATGGKLGKKGADLFGIGKGADKATGLAKLPPHVRKRIEEGNEFNRVRRAHYPHNEVRLGNNKVVDSYTPGKEIVERKHTELSEIKPETAKQYINSLVNKYPPGQIIADTPANRAASPDLIGTKLEGKQILEIPPQRNDVPPAILQHARDNGIIIRDSNGKVY